MNTRTNEPKPTEQQVNQVNCQNSDDLYKQMQEAEAQGNSITKIYNQPRRGIFSFFFKPKK
jgi:hypothetical protein